MPDTGKRLLSPRVARRRATRRGHLAAAVAVALLAGLWLLAGELHAIEDDRAADD